ncbi:MAG: hypothetical protein ACTHLX_10025, partial [Candidatus Binatia bacterium]
WSEYKNRLDSGMRRNDGNRSRLPVDKFRTPQLVAEGCSVFFVVGVRAQLPVNKRAQHHVTIDLRFPDMNGIEVARELQKIPETADIPVIAWTAELSREATSRYVGSKQACSTAFKSRFR